MKPLHSLVLILAMVAAASAQIEVGVDVKRHMFIRGEPVEVTVAIRNLSGKDIMLRDVDRRQWFGFEVIKGDDTPVAPHSADYKNDPLMLLAGDSVHRKVDLLKLFPVTEFSSYKIRPAIYFHETGKYYTSDFIRLDVTEGRKLWTRTVGVPPSKDGAGELRRISLLTFQLPKEMTLYVRVEDDASGDILGTYPLGRFLGGTTPTTEFDNDNTLHVMQLVATGQYQLSKIGVNGDWLGQTIWNSEKGRAIVRKKPDGTMVVVGARRADLRPTPGPPVPKLSDRPVLPPR